MKKLAVVCLAAVAAVAVCIGVYLARPYRMLLGEGVAPYPLTAREESLLQSFGLQSSAQALAFRAPKEAITLRITTYRLGEDKTWEQTDRGGCSIGAPHLAGTFTMQVSKNFSFVFYIDCDGLVESYTGELLQEEDMAAFTRTFLSGREKIVLNREIPVALLVYDQEGSMPGRALKDYFAPETEFEGMDLVQAVTLTFSDQPL